MRSFIAVSLAVGTLVGLGSVAEAGKKVKPSQMTCEDFLAVDEQARPQVLYWIAGYNRAGQEEVDIDVLSKPITAAVVEECRKDPKATFWDKIKSKL